MTKLSKVNNSSIKVKSILELNLMLLLKTDFFTMNERTIKFHKTEHYWELIFQKNKTKILIEMAKQMQFELYIS